MQDGRHRPSPCRSDDIATVGAGHNKQIKRSAAVRSAEIDAQSSRRRLSWIKHRVARSPLLAALSRACRHLARRQPPVGALAAGTAGAAAGPARSHDTHWQQQQSNHSTRSTVQRVKPQSAANAPPPPSTSASDTASGHQLPSDPHPRPITGYLIMWTQSALAGP